MIGRLAGTVSSSSASMARRTRRSASSGTSSSIGSSRCEQALLDQRHGRHRGDRLGQRRDPEDGVARQGVGRRTTGVPMVSIWTSSPRATSVTSPGRRAARHGAAIDSCNSARAARERVLVVAGPPALGGRPPARMSCRRRAGVQLIGEASSGAVRPSCDELRGLGRAVRGAAIGVAEAGGDPGAEPRRRRSTSRRSPAAASRSRRQGRRHGRRCSSAR